MKHYSQNAKWLLYFAPFRVMSISAAYLTPFFLEKGLGLTEIFLLQSIFSIAYLVWELPSGFLADRFGRAFSIKISAPISALAMIAYGFSGEFWQFVVCELVLALANGLISGVDTALLLDSLKADGKEKQFVKRSQRINSLGFAATACGVPVAVALAQYIGVSSTIVADGVLTAIGAFFAFKLVEAPRYNGSQEQVRLSAWHAVKQLGKNREARWLIALGASLSTSTYLAFWLATPYYKSMNIPVALFGVILAARSLFKFWVSRTFSQERHLERNMVSYALTAGLVYFGMASGHIWLLWVVLGHDVVQALQSQPIAALLNNHMHHEYRATLNSLTNLIQRLLYSLAGPLVGILIDRTNLEIGFVVTGSMCSATALIAIRKLHQLKTFR